MPVPPAFPALDDTMGAWLLGTFFGILLQGVGYHQTYRYFRLYRRDPYYLKIWVVLLLITETANTALFMHTTYYYLVTNYSKPTVLFLGPVWSLKLLPVPASLSAVITQTFFARRIFLLNSRFRPIAAVLIFAFCGSFCAFTVLGWNKATMAEFLDLSWLASVASGLIMLADLMMTIVLIMFLRRNHTGVIRTDSILDLLIMYAVSSGLIICIFNVLNVTFSIIWPSNLVYTAISIILTKLYSNTFLVSVNARQSLLLKRAALINEGTPFSTTVLRHTRRTSSGIDVSVQKPSERGSNTKQASGSPDTELKVVTVLVSSDTHSCSDVDQYDQHGGIAV
ncbi:hypothetical protein C8Q80DRAFT_1274223 [Daedaleopsis nitida]|nr:hypothetical protein C8Q80DRAFT_1274223 [Daedaleopsis nitida]